MLKFTDCKINIGLDIVSRRPDGYHDIVTAMVPVSWHDIVEIVPDQSMELVCLGNPVACDPEQNLVMRAYRTMKEEFGLPDAKIVLEKVVPDGAGLGGGSADASAVILLCNELYGLGLKKEKMAEIAAKMGADCPFFIYQKPMLATGIGTDLTPIHIDLSGYTLLIAKIKGITISTRQAYAGVKPQMPVHPLPQLLQLPVEQWQGKVKNDFEPSIFAQEPRLLGLKEVMLEGGATYASMTGSGCAVYGLFADDKISGAKGLNRVKDLQEFLTSQYAKDAFGETCQTYVGQL